MKMAILLSCLTGTFVFAQPDPSQLIGKWKMENKDSYEVWRKSGEKLTGYCYKLTEGQERITDRMELTKVGEQWIYTATVPDQNEGRSIPFKLNTNEKDRLSFENPAHDFPVKIQYEFNDMEKVLVRVLGPDDKGFSYYLNRVE